MKRVALTPMFFDTYVFWTPMFFADTHVFCCGIPESESFAEHHRHWVNEALRNGPNNRESIWTESIAIGSSSYVEEIKRRLGIKASGRKIETQGDGICTLREE